MININGVKGYLIVGDVKYLWDLAQSLPANGNYLEIGSWMGLSSIIIANSLLAKLNFGSRIYCVDTWQGSEEHQEMKVIQEDKLFETFLANIQEAGVSGLITPVRGKSVDASRKFSEASLDILFVDGDHSFEGCYADLVAWSPKVKPGGRILGHDAAPSCGAYEAVAQFCHERGLEFKITDPPAAHHIFEIFQK
jgi:predicted O-methyltransferase YrrM